MNKKEREFVAQVFDYYETYGRHELPWRLTQDPYLILVSELMLQQTQVERVILKYEAFVKRWPTAKQLASASLADVLKAWQGLGYNRRAKFLYQCAQIVTNERGGGFPISEEELRNLPGIGPYTASALCAFAYNQPVVLIETNVRRVFLHHFYPNAEAVTDTEIMSLVRKTLPNDNAREWYAALMDYGTHLKREFGNANVRSKHYKKQSMFEGSDRQIRGVILRELAEGGLTRGQLRKRISDFSPTRVDEQLEKLVQEGLISRTGLRFQLG